MYNNYYGGNYYYYTYEARTESLFGNPTLILSPEYLSSLLLPTILLGLLAMALVLVPAILVKKGRVYGIITAIAQPIGLFAAMKAVTSYSAIDFSSLICSVTSSVSMEDAMSKLYAKVWENFVANVWPGFSQYLIWVLVLAVVTIMTIVYAGMLFKAKGKGFAIFAFILLILRHLFIAPVEFITLFMGQGSEAVQTVWDLVFRFAFILPLILIAAVGLFNIKKAKEEPAKPAAPAPDMNAAPDANAESPYATPSDPAKVNEANENLEKLYDEAKNTNYKW